MGWVKRALGLERKDSAVGPMIALRRVGQAVWSPRNYRGFATEGYSQNVVAYRSIRMIAENVAAVMDDVLLYEGDREMTEHPLKAVLARPNPWQAGSELIDFLVAYFKIHGDGFLEAVMLDGQLRELYALRPDRMKAVAGRRGYPQAWDYSVDGTNKHRFQMPDMPDEQSPIMHLREFHPLDDWMGLSPVEPAAFSIDVHNSAGNYNKALLDNGASPSGALSYEKLGDDDDGTLTDEQFDRLRHQFEERHQGTANAGKPLILEGGLKWQTMGMSPKDLEFVVGKREAAREIALAFGVPPMLLGIPGDNTYCLPADARVETDKGPIAIGDIREGDIVISGAMRPRKVTWQGCVGRKMVHELRLTNRTICCTDNHPIWTRRDKIVDGRTVSSMEYIPAGQLRKGDIVAIAHSLPEREPCESVPTISEMELFGFYSGDGSSALAVKQSEGRGYRRGGFVSLAIPEGASYGNHYEDLLHEATGNPVKQRERARVSSSSEFAERLAKLGLTGTAHTKRVPQWVFQTPLAHRLAYLRGMIDSDGHVDANGRAVIDLASEELVRDLWHLGLSCGLQLGRVVRREDMVKLPQGTDFHQVSYRFMVSRAEHVAMIGTNTPEYQERIAANLGKGKGRPKLYTTGSTVHEEKVRSLIVDEHVSFARLLSVSEIGEMDVYDIEVEGDHDFIADGVIVHNSNYQEARLALYEETVLPLASKICKALANWMEPTYPGIRLGYDEDRIPALVARREMTWKRVSDADFITTDEKREATGYGEYKPDPNKPGGTILVSGTMVPMDDVGFVPGGGAPPDAE